MTKIQAKTIRDCQQSFLDVYSEFDEEDLIQNPDVLAAWFAGERLIASMVEPAITTIGM